jgi:hypothetical protein
LVINPAGGFVPQQRRDRRVSRQRYLRRRSRTNSTGILGRLGKQVGRRLGHAKWEPDRSVLQLPECERDPASRFRIRLGQTLIGNLARLRASEPERRRSAPASQTSTR